MCHLVCKACRGSGVRLISEGRHSDAVTVKIILKIVSENLRRSLCCHSYSSGLQKYLNNSNKHDIRQRLAYWGFSLCEIVFHLFLGSLLSCIHRVVFVP